MFTVFAALIVTLVTLFYYWQKRVYRYWTDRGLPQMKGKFPMGSLLGDKNIAYNIDDIYRQYKGKTKYIGMYFMTKPILLVLEEELSKHIMVRDAHYTQSHGGFHNEVDDPLSSHLFSLDGQKWKDLRAKLSPTFTSGKMKSMCPIVVDIGNRFKDTMGRLVESGAGAHIDMRDMFARFLIDVIGTCAFGLDCNSLEEPDSEFLKMGVKQFDEPRHSQAVTFFIFLYPKLAKRLRMKFISDDVSEFFLRVVNDTVEHRVKNNVKRNDFMDLMIGLRNEKKSNSIEDSHMDGLSMNEIAAQCFLFFSAGFETSSSTSSFTLYELAKNQDIQDKLRAHLQDVLEKHDGQITYEALKEMTYLEQCIKEGLRLYPPVATLSRNTMHPYKVPETDIVLPEGTSILLPAYSFHMDPNNFPDPHKFDPNRFSAEEAAKRHPFAHIAFGEGPRVCLGERFALMQVKVGLANLIRNFRVKLNPKSTKPIVFRFDSFVTAPDETIYFDLEKL